MVTREEALREGMVSGFPSAERGVILCYHPLELSLRIRNNDILPTLKPLLVRSSMIWIYNFIAFGKDLWFYGLLEPVKFYAEKLA